MADVDTFPDSMGLKTNYNVQATPFKSIFTTNNSETISSDVAHLEDNKYSLPFQTAYLFATILEDSITQITILTQCTNEIRTRKAQFDLYELQRKKYGVAPSLIVEDTCDMPSKKLHSIHLKMEKLENDRKVIINYLTTFYLKLAFQSSFKPIVLCLETLTGKISSRKYLEESIVRNKTLNKDLQRHLRQQRNQNKSTLNEMDLVIRTMKNEMQDSEILTVISSRYVVKWMHARTEQHADTIANKEAVPEQSIELFKQKYEHEQRAHTEVELITTIAINETLQKIEEWMIKYDVDMEAVELKIQKAKVVYDDTVKYKHSLEEKLEKHNTLIVNWKHFKDERVKARLYVEKMTNSAFIIQAWWRGLLVRLQIGPYKVKKGKRGGKSKK